MSFLNGFDGIDFRMLPAVVFELLLPDFEINGQLAITGRWWSG
jgi:hypothetical protein